MNPDDPLPSLGVVLRAVEGGRQERLTHLDALDQKAGLALGFAGVLVTLSTDIAQPWRATGTTMAIAAAVFALSSFWPRQHRGLGDLRRYLNEPMADTQVALIDALDEMNRRMSRFADMKGNRLKVALAALVLAVATLGMGAGEQRSGGGHEQRGATGLAAAQAAPGPAAPR